MSSNSVLCNRSSSSRIPRTVHSVMNCNWYVRQWVASSDGLISLSGNPPRSCCYCYVILLMFAILWKIKLSRNKAHINSLDFAVGSCFSKIFCVKSRATIT